MKLNQYGGVVGILSLLLVVVLTWGQDDGLNMAVGEEKPDKRKAPDQRETPNSPSTPKHDAQEPIDLQSHESPPTGKYIPQRSVMHGTVPVEPNVKVTRGPFISVQVNIDALGNNIVGDAANEPSIAIDPTNPNNIVIGWRQFDTIESDFRQAGYAYSHDGGQTWAFPGPLYPGVFGSDPVLEANADGVFYYVSIDFSELRVFRSYDAEVTWEPPAVIPRFLDKPWMSIDRTDGPGRGNIYIATGYNGPRFYRSTDNGISFTEGQFSDNELDINWGTQVVAPNGTVYIIGRTGDIGVSIDANVSGVAEPTIEYRSKAPGISFSYGGTPNPDGLLGQAWIAVNRRPASSKTMIYAFATSRGEAKFTRSDDSGLTWADPVRVDDDLSSNSALWFGTMSVAPNGRIDVIWNDTRNTNDYKLSETFYAYSFDDGETWSPNVPVGPVWDSNIGWPQQRKIGDYYHMISDNGGAGLAYATTYNGEQDVYFLRITSFDCNNNSIDDPEEVDMGLSPDCNGNIIPDECEHNDCNENNIPDDCDLASGTLSDDNKNLMPDECEQRLYVDYDATGANDGSSWTDAYQDLQDALDDARAPDQLVTEIWVAQGVYRPDRGTEDPASTFELVSDVALYGGFSGNEQDLNERDPDAHETILSCDLLGDDLPDFSNYEDNCYHVITGRLLSEYSILDGFTISGGALDEEPISTSYKGGGGINLFLSELQTRRCQIKSNRGIRKAAIFTHGGNPSFTHCQIRNNLSLSTRVAVIECKGPATFEDCLIVGNKGGGLEVQSSTAQIRHSIIVGQRGYGIVAPLDASLITGNIVWENARVLPSPNLGQLLFPITDLFGPIIAEPTYNLIQGWDDGDVGNTADDPMFVDLGYWDDQGTPNDKTDDVWIEGDYHLMSGSPAINTGDPAYVPDAEATDFDGNPRLQGCRVDRGAYESNETQPTGDFDASSRIDLRDYALFQNCFGAFDTEASYPEWAQTCICVLDFTDDETLTIEDVLGFTQNLQGP